MELKILLLSFTLTVSKAFVYEPRFGKNDILRINYNVLFLDISQNVLEMTNNGGLTFFINLPDSSDLRISDKANIAFNQNYIVPLLDLPQNEFAGLDHDQLLHKFKTYNFTNTAYEGIDLENLLKQFFDSCQSLSNSFNFAYDRINLVADKIDMINRTLHTALPGVSDPKRIKKRFLTFLSRPVSYLFGLARSSELNSLSDTIKLIENSQSDSNALINELHQSISDITDKHNSAISSLLSAQHSLTNSFINFEKRFEAMLGGLQYTNKRLIISQLTGMKDLGLVTSVINEVLWKLDNLQTLHLKLSLGLNDMIRNRLPSSLISFTELRDSLSSLRTKLNNSFSNYRIIDLPITFFYRSAVSVSHMFKNNIYISLNVPLKRENHPGVFKLYRIVKLQNPISPNKATVLSTVYSYLGVSLDKEYGFLFTTADYVSCKGNEFLRCRAGILIQKFSSIECFYALYMDIKDRILSECDYFIEKHNIEHSGIFHINHYLIINKFSPSLQTECQGEIQNVDVCDGLCLLEINCNCSIKSNELAFPYFDNVCVESSERVKLFNSINVPLISKYRNYSDLTHIFGNTLYQKGQNVPSLRQSEMKSLLRKVNE